MVCNGCDMVIVSTGSFVNSRQFGGTVRICPSAELKRVSPNCAWACAECRSAAEKIAHLSRLLIARRQQSATLHFEAVILYAVEVAERGSVGVR